MQYYLRCFYFATPSKCTYLTSEPGVRQKWQRPFWKRCGMSRYIGWMLCATAQPIFVDAVCRFRKGLYHFCRTTGSGLTQVHLQGVAKKRVLSVTLKCSYMVDWFPPQPPECAKHKEITMYCFFFYFLSVCLKRYLHCNWAKKADSKKRYIYFFRLRYLKVNSRSVCVCVGGG